MGHKKLAKAVYQQFHGFLESDKNWHKKLAKTEGIQTWPMKMPALQTCLAVRGQGNQ
jgi:hypothetical protein